MSYTFKPQLRSLGKKLGPKLPAVRKALSELDGDKAWETYKKEGRLTLDLDGEEIVLEEEDLIIETGDAEGYAVMNEGDLTVALDLRLDDALIARGYVREIISKVQNMRKDADFEVSDRIRLYYDGSEKLNKVIFDHADQIASEVLAEEITAERRDDAEKRDINGETCYLSVERV